MIYWSYIAGSFKIIFRGHGIPEELYLDNRWMTVDEFIANSIYGEEGRHNFTNTVMSQGTITQSEAAMMIFEWNK